MRIIVEHGKHDTEYYDASTPEKHKESALKILAGRMDYYIHPPSENHKKEVQAELTAIKAQLEALGDADELNDLRRYIKAKLNRAQGNYDRYEEEGRVYERAKRALDTNDGALAWQVLRDRSDYEYEQVELVELQ